MNRPMIPRAASRQSLLTRRQFLAGIVTAPLLAGLYAWQVEPTWVEYVNRELPIANLPEALSGKILVQLSDTHIGPQVDDGYVTGVFEKIASLNPDIVVHTGDIISYAGPKTIEQARKVLACFPRGKLGTVAILGNHDYGQNWNEPSVAEQMKLVLTETGCTVLRNTAVGISGLTIVGLDDLWAGQFAPQSVLGSLDRNQPSLVLSHNPDTCDLPEWDNYQGWILSGHTHGGQCRPPFLPPPLVAVKNHRYTAGEFALTGSRQLYITRGVGHLLKVRFNSRPEVTVFTLMRA
jgi:uncharacterized protein